ncbi:hypothetical protein [Sphingomonas crusticola]|uniref:hypothetical protein n=1 Tax=Sphingomonas crusticola TaxID=1697973 RepID=UPI000E26CB44|nr:hypothetical protein [Sphingomonas crusticola]
MTKSATDLMQEIIFASLIDAVGALRTASKGVPNAMLRDVQAIGPNTSFADLPKELQTSIGESVRQAFNRLLKEGYSVSPGRPAPPPVRPRPPAGGGPRPQGPGGPRPQAPGGARPPQGRPGQRPGARPGGNRDGRPPKPRGK